jgi:hypothetical protein
MYLIKGKGQVCALPDPLENNPLAALLGWNIFTVRNAQQSKIIIQPLSDLFFWAFLDLRGCRSRFK